MAGRGSVKLSIYSTFDDKGAKQAERAMNAFTKKYGTLNKETGQMELSGTTQQLVEQSIAADKAAAKLQGYSDRLDHAAKVMQPFSAGAAGAITASVGLASSYETGLAKVATITDKSQMSMQDMGNALLDLSTQSGRSVTELEEAAYQAQSASVATKDTVGFVGTAVKLSKSGFTDTSTAVDTLTTVINAYGMSAEDAASISDKLVNTQNKGKTTVDELGQSIGNVIPTAAAYGVSLDNLLTGYVDLTKQGINTANATTYLNGMFTELADGGSDVSKILKDKTGKSFSDLMGEGKSLGDVLQILYDATGNNSTEFANLWGNVRAGKGALAIVNAGTDEFNAQLHDMADATGVVDSALDDLVTPASQANKAINAMKNTGVQLGEVFLATVEPGLEQAQGAASKLYTAFSKMDAGQRKTVATVLTLTAAAAPALKLGSKAFALASKGATAYAKLSAKLAELSTHEGLAGKAAGMLGKGLDVVTKAAGGLAVALTAVKIGDAIINQVTGLNDAASAAQAQLDATGGSFETFGQRIASATAQTADMSGVVASTGKTVGELQSTIDDKESQITAILQERFGEQQGLRDQDIQNIQNYTQQIQDAEKTKLDTYTATLDGWGDAAKAEGNISQESAAQYLANAKGTYDQALSDLDAYQAQRMAAINQQYPTEADKQSEAYQREIQDATNYYTQMRDALTRHYQDTKSKIAGSMQEISTDQVSQWESLKGVWDHYSDYNGWEKFNTNLNEAFNSPLLKQKVTDYTNQLNSMDLATTSSFLQQELTVATSTGKIGADVKNMGDDILDTMYDMPGPMQDAATSAMRSLAAGMDDQLGIDVANSTADQIIDAFRSKVGDAEVVGGETSQGYADGLDSNGAAAMGAQALAAQVNAGLATADGYTPGVAASGGFGAGVAAGSVDATTGALALAQAVSGELATTDGYNPGLSASTAYASGVGSQGAAANQAAAATALSAYTGLSSQSGAVPGASIGATYAAAVAGQARPAQSGGAATALSAYTGLNSQRGTAPGTNLGTAYVSAVRGQSGAARAGGASVASSAQGGLSTADGSSAGSSLGAGFVAGIGSWLGGAASAAASLARSAVNALHAAIRQGSPSKVTMQSGRFFGQGFSIGIRREASAAYSAARDTALAAVRGMGSVSVPTPTAPVVRAGATYARTHSAQAASADAQAIIQWLDANLGAIIYDSAPTATPREFGRMVRRYT